MIDHCPSIDGRVILFVNRFPALSETFIIDQIDALVARGIDVSVVALRRDESGLLHEKGRQLATRATYVEGPIGLPKTLPLSIRSRFVPSWLENRKLKDVLKGAKLVICHFGPVGLHAARILEKVRGPRLWTIFHGYDISSYVRQHGSDVYDALFARGDRFLGVSKLWGQRLKELGCPDERIGLLRMGIDADRIGFAQRRFDANKTLRICSIARLVEKKGIEFALQALAIVRRVRPAFDWSYEVIGDGPLRHRLQRLAADLAIDDRVRFSGKLPAEAVQARIAECDIFILPSVTADNGNMEGIPVALMEAMASGASVLSTWHSGIPELVKHEVTGLLAPERAPDNLAQNLCRLLDEPERRSAMALAARDKVVREFNQKTIADDLAADIKETLASDR